MACPLFVGDVLHACGEGQFDLSCITGIVRISVSWEPDGSANIVLRGRYCGVHGEAEAELELIACRDVNLSLRSGAAEIAYLVISDIHERQMEDLAWEVSDYENGTFHVVCRAILVRSGC